MIEIKTMLGTVLFVAETAKTVSEAVVAAVRAGRSLGGADLRGADLGGADLRGADLRGADLGGADLGGAYLRGAYLRSAYLRSAYLRSAYLQDIRTDFYAVLDAARSEVSGLYRALLDGRIDGSVYEGECACLVGTIAKLRGCAYKQLNNLVPNSERPAERWFLAIRRGDTPESNAVAAVTADWMREYMKQHVIPVPTRRVVWEG